MVERAAPPPSLSILTTTGSSSSASSSANATAASASAAATATAGSHHVTSPRNDFFVSQRVADFELSRVDSLSLEEQEILASIQELQLQLMQLRAEQDEDSSDDDDAAGSAAASNVVPGSGAASQLIVVSNNLPVLLERVPASGRWKATKTTGGLDKLMCLTGVRSDLNFLWVGWVGQHIPKHEHESVRRLLLQHNCLPVFLSSDVATRHNAFSSDVLWSLFHYVSEPVVVGGSSASNAKRFSKQDWRAYESANESFADAIAEIYNEGDSVWVHDYHLMLLPSLLRQRLPLGHIGWFLHTPFPGSDVYTRLPVRTELLRGVLQADLVGFQTFDYERHFVATCQRLLGVDVSHQGIRTTLGARDHITSIGVFPIGISVEPFARAAASVATLHRVNELHRKFGSKRIVLGVDRLDDIKGIPHKLLAMEALLSRFPEWQHNVVLLQIGISSRSGVVDSSSSGLGATAAVGAGATAAVADDSADVDAPAAASSASPARGNHQNSSSSSSHHTNNGNAAAMSAGVTPTGATQAAAPATTAAATTAAGATTTTANASASAVAASYDATHQLETSSHSYRTLLAQVNQLVGRINGTFGALDYTPIHFIHQRVLQHEELCALYDLADVCLVTSTRDGMNLVSHEFVVCQQHFMRRKPRLARPPPPPPSLLATRAPGPSAASSFESPKATRKSASFSSPQVSPTKILTEWEGEEGGPGVLIVSEFAGCSQSLSGALVVNPWNTEDVALSVHQALSMCRAEREIRQQKLYRYVSTNTATAWSMLFLGDLGDAVQQNRRDSRQLPRLDTAHLVASYRRAQNRVIILDYDRTLTPQHALLPLAAVGPNFKALLDTLSADARNTVFILSARERKFLETWLQGVRVGVAAEDGFFYRMNLGNDREQWKTMSKFQYDSAARAAGAAYPLPTTVRLDHHNAQQQQQQQQQQQHHSRRSMSLGAIPSFADSNPPSTPSPSASLARTRLDSQATRRRRRPRDDTEARHPHRRSRRRRRRAKAAACSSQATTRAAPSATTAPTRRGKISCCRRC
ncbi:hypothetical protein PINS_up007942 [Pythium insidiosum]|nr:hypothetical protein PINS_up007942 [Pythium insidiosum]